MLITQLVGVHDNLQRLTELHWWVSDNEYSFERGISWGKNVSQTEYTSA